MPSLIAFVYLIMFIGMSNNSFAVMYNLKASILYCFEQTIRVKLKK